MNNFRARALVASLICAASFADVVLLARAQAQSAPAGAAAAVESTPVDYLIGPEDVLTVSFWRDQDQMSGDQTVRPDGMISLLLIGDIKAAGLRPEQLREEIRKAANRFLTDPSVSVAVKTINSRKVYITGEVATPGAQSLNGRRRISQVIAAAGGLTEYADSASITLSREENGILRSYKFNYKEVSRGRNLVQDIQVEPGDTIFVP